ncbi:MAG TPA: hypothetical protein DCG28_00535 [Lachnospiraceae bacterium]|nr:hypothetical protein [Lachnospiraceae bacterium]
MRKNFLTKAIAAVGVTVGTLVMSSVGVFAAMTASTLENSTTWSFIDVSSSTTSVTAMNGTAKVDTKFNSGGGGLSVAYTSQKTGVTFASGDKGGKFNKKSNLTSEYVKVPVAEGDILYVYFATNGGNQATLSLFDTNTEKKLTSMATTNETTKTIHELSYTVEKNISSVTIISDGYDGTTPASSIQIAGLVKVSNSAPSTDPSISLSTNSIQLTPGEDGIEVTANTANIGDATITWSKKSTDSENITFTPTTGNSTTISANSNATSSDTATITASVTLGDNTFKDSVTVTVANPGVVLENPQNICTFTNSSNNAIPSNKDYFETGIKKASKTGLYVKVNNTEYTVGAKLESTTVISFNATSSGTLYLVTNPNLSKTVSVNGTEYTPESNLITVTNIPVGKVTIQRGNGENHIMYIAYSGTIGRFAGTMYGNGAQNVTSNIIISENGNVYVVANKKITDASVLEEAESATLTINNVNALTDSQLYKNVSASDITAIGSGDNEYLLGVMVDEVTTNSQIAALQTATVDIALN